MRIKLYASIIALATFLFSNDGFAQVGADDPCNGTLPGSVLSVTANGPCVTISGTNIGFTPSGVATGPCSGVNNNDLWYSFTVPAGVTTLLGQVDGGGAGAMDFPIVYFYRGPCTALTVLGCNTGFPPASTGSFMYSNFVPGETIWVRVKPLGGTSDGTFTLCVYNPCPTGPPSNDEPCGATPIAMTANCAGYTTISNFCATSSGDYISTAGATSAGTTITVSSTIGLYPGMPVDVAAGVGAFAPGTTVATVINLTTFTVSAAPTVPLSGGGTIVTGQGPPAPGCANFQGNDIWLTTTVGANGHIEINFQQQSLNDPAVAVYSGTGAQPCANLTLLACNDDAGPNLMPYIFIIDPTLAGQTVWIRVWDFGGNNFGTMGICLTDPCPSGAAVNDEPCGAINVPMTATPCTNFSTFSTTCASGSISVPAPACGNYQGGDVWFRTTVGANGHLGITTRANTLFNGGAAIYTGACNALTEVACFPGPFQFGMPFLYVNTLPPGATVYIRFWVPGNFTTGSFDICLSDPCPGGTVIPPIYDDPPCPPPATPAGYLPFTSGPCNTYTNYTSVCSNTGLSNSPLPLGTQDPVGCSGPFYPPAAFTSANWDVWSAFIVPSLPATGFIDFNTQAGTVNDLDIAIYRINGGYANNCNNPAAYQMLMCDDLGGPVFMPYLHLPYGGANPVQPGDTIMIRMWDYFGSTPGNWGMCINNPCPGGTVPPPAYDDPPCPAAAQLLPVTGGPCIAYQAGDNICAGATTDPSQAALCGFPNGSNDVWYVIQMPLVGSGQLDFNFQGGLSMNDPVVSIYSGCPVACGGGCSGLTLLDCNDDGGVGLLPYISLSNPVPPGQFLYIRVHGFAGGRGTFGICVNDPCPSQPSNDIRCNPIPLSVGTNCNFITASIVCASTDNFGIPAPGCGNYNGRDVWYSFTAPASGAVIIDSRPGSLSDIGMAVYHSLSGNDCTAGFIVDACDDNTGTGNMPFLSLTSLTPGRTYWLRIWEDGGNQDGDFDICIYNPCPGGPPVNDVVCNAQLLSLNNITPGFNNCATAESFTTIAPNSPTCWTHQAPYNTASFMNTVWYKVVGDTSYTVVVSPLTMTRPQVAVYKPTVGQACGSLVAPMKLGANDVCNNGSAIGCKPAPTSAVVAIDGGQVSNTTPGFQSTDTLYIAVDGVNGEIGDFEIAVYNTDLSTLPPVAVYDCRRAVPICGIITSVSDPGYTNSGNICDLTSNTEYKTFVSTATATSNAAGTVTLAGGDNTNALSVGMMVSSSGGTGGNIPISPTVATTCTRIVSITNATQFVVSPIPSPVLINSTITASIRPTYTSATGATSAGTTITVASTTGLNPGMTITVTGGTGLFPVGTTVASITNATTFVSSSAPTVALAGGAVVTGTRYPIDSRAPEVNSSWYFFSSTGVAGSMAFDITGNSGTNYDYLLWDITAGGSFTGQNTTTDGTICDQIRNSGVVYGPPIRANVAYSTGPTGVGALYTTNTSYSPPVTVPGSVRTYMLCVINTDGNGSGFTLEFSNFSPINYSASSVVWNDGSGSTNWFDPGNWGSCLAPVCAVHATIQNAPDQPVITANATVNNLTISSGSSLTLMPGVTLSICGNFTNSGDFIAAPTSTVRFVGGTATGATGQIISGNFVGTNAFPNVVIDKPVVGTPTATAPSSLQVVNVSSTAGLSVGNAIFVTAGTGAFRMGTTITSIPGVYASPAGAVNNNFPTYTSAPGATNANAVITVGSTVGLYPGMIVTVTAGTGAFAPRTYITTVSSGTTFSVHVAPTTPLSGGAVVTATGTMIGVPTTGTLLPGQLITVSSGTGSFPASTTVTSVINYSATGVSSAGATVTITTPTGAIYPGMMLSMTGGTGVFAAGTVVATIISATQFTVAPAPTTPLSGASIAAAGFGTSALPSVALSGGAVVSGGPVIGISAAPAVVLGTGATIKAAAGVVTLSTNADITGSLNMATNCSHLNATGRNIRLERNFTNASGNGTFNSTGSTIEFNGTGVQTFINNGNNAWYDLQTGQFTLNNVYINQQDGTNDYVDLHGSSGTDNNMRIFSSAALTLGSGRIFTNQWEVYIKNPFPTGLVTHPLCAFGVAGTINPVCSNSYVEGKLTRNVRRTGTNETYAFAVGEGGYAEYAYVTRINSSGGSTTSDTLKLSAVFKSWPAAPPSAPSILDPSCGGPTLADWSVMPVYDHGYWTIDSSSRIITGNSTIGAYNICVRPNDNLVGNVDGAALLWSVMKRTPSGSGLWALDGTCSSPPSSMYDAYRNNLNKFSDFAVVQSGNVLPIELLFFNAEQTDDGVLCSWITASEINNDYFVVERSYDGKEYVALGTIAGAGNSSTTLHYSFLDKSICYGLAYYRLKQVDFDGKTTYYNDRVVAVDCKTRNPISLRPNPAQSEIFSEFKMSSDAKVKLEVLDIMGQVVQSQSHDVTQGDNVLKTEISKLAPGVYYMKITKEGFGEASFLEKFMKY